MKALSIRQPWAWLICKGYKDIESRTWWLHMPPLLNYPEHIRRIYVHASKTIDKEAYIFIPDKYVPLPEEAYSNTSAIIGEVDITGCVDKSDSPWFIGPYGLTLANPVLYERAIPCRGKLGFFEPDITKGG